MGAGSRKVRRALTVVASAMILLPILFVIVWCAVFDHITSGACNISMCKTRAEVAAKLSGFRERRLAFGERPVWPFLHAPNGKLPKRIVTREYRFWGLPWRHAAICVAYDNSDRVVGLYEYD